MTRCLFRFILTAALAAAAFCRAPEPLPDEELSYTFELSRGPDGPQVQATLSLAGDEDASTEFQIQPSWADVKDTRGSVGQVQAFGEQQRRLEAFQSGSHSWTVIHRPREGISLSYQLRSGTDLSSSDPSSSYRVLIGRDVFHMIGHVGLIVPSRVGNGRMCRFRVDWKGFAEAGWKVVSSFSADQKGFEVREPLGRFVHSLFFAGRLRLYPRFVEGNLLQLAIYGDWKFPDGRFIDLAQSITQAERDFFRDHSQPFFLVTLLPVGDESGGNMGGTGLTNSFALFVSPHYTLEAGSGPSVQKLLAHELFHHWNSGLSVDEESEALIYWFTEGFTDFYARRLLFRAGLMSAEQYAQSLSEAFAALLLSPVRNQPNQRIAEGFWSDREIKELPYHRGDVVALLLDHEVRRLSQGARSLDDLMREVAGRASNGQQDVSTESLLELFAGYTSSEFAANLRRVIVEGRTPEFPPDLGSPEVRMKVEDLGRFELGFDWDATQRSRRVRGVARQSRAWQAGLRNGQRLQGWSLRMGDVSFPVTLTVFDGALRKITYLPQTVATEQVPQFEAN